MKNISELSIIPIQLGSLEVSPENHDMAPLNSSLTLNALKVYADWEIQDKVYCFLH